MNPDRHWKSADRGQRGPHPLDLALAPRDDDADQSLARSLEEALFDRLQHHEYGQNQQGGEKGDGVLRSPSRHADRRHRPDGRGGREPPDQVLSKEDRSRPQKADAGHDLGRDPGGIRVREAVRAHDREQARSERHHGHGPKPGRPLLALALEADDSAQDKRHQQAQHEIERTWHGAMVLPRQRCCEEEF